MKALLSVYDKAGLVDFARALHGLGYGLVSTGGTHKALAEAGLPVQQVSDLTGFPEMLDGRVKTLHPKVHGGILARRDVPDHVSQLKKLGIEPIDVVAVNLYPFRETVRKPGVTLEEALENIDIGGPTLLRAAAKNFPSVVVVVDPRDYGWVAEKLQAGGLSLGERRGLARKAFQHMAFYDSAIAHYLRRPDDSDLLSDTLTLGLEKLHETRYGENPHQKGALYAAASGARGLASARQLHGQEMSFNNWLDASAAWLAVVEFQEPAVAVIKHTNPCGLAIHQDQAEAYRRAHAGDPVSAYGGIVAFNRPVTAEAAQAMAKVFYEVVIAPDYEPAALSTFQKRKNLRVLAMPDASQSSHLLLEVRQVAGAFLLQTPDVLAEDPSTWKVVTQQAPTPQQREDLAFAWKVAKHVKSNAIVIAKEKQLLGMGAGQPNRVTSVRLAAQTAGERASGAVLASDAMFPFADNVEEAARAGVSAVVQPGGSIRDQEVIEAADRLGLAMVFTGIRHFRH
ncbi:MAG: bifunctional phosphoribosylaminoimidazolecarboxamide formyltransferase/IMP cyclohydrolase [Chloroflexi bacterium]|nr:bifunctional phosphoribosylaminoimidazolecarboxamide formyltransferase/IMP cyclohydrolase [Chloroflexota bacterium]